MKKKYEKPVLIIESFQLDATIAASCSSEGYIPLGYAEDNCAHDSGYFNLDNCVMPVPGAGGDANDGLCYHGPTATGGMTFICS